MTASREESVWGDEVVMKEAKVKGWKKEWGAWPRG